jgi:hypothetical protein
MSGILNSLQELLRSVNEGLAPITLQVLSDAIAYVPDFAGHPVLRLEQRYAR